MLKQEQFSIKPAADGTIFAVLRAGVREGESLPPSAGGEKGAVVLAATTNDTGKFVRSWDRSPTKGGFFVNNITEDGDNACVSWAGKKGVVNSVVPVPNDWTGKPQFRLSIFSEAPLEPMGGAGPNAAVSVLMP